MTFRGSENWIKAAVHDGESLVTAYLNPDYFEANQNRLDSSTVSISSALHGATVARNIHGAAPLGARRNSETSRGVDMHDINNWGGIPSEGFGINTSPREVAEIILATPGEIYKAYENRYEAVSAQRVQTVASQALSLGVATGDPILILGGIAVYIDASAHQFIEGPDFLTVYGIAGDIYWLAISAIPGGRQVGGVYGLVHSSTVLAVEEARKDGD